METGFTIDDVRDTMTRDVSRSLGRIERAARDVLDDPARLIEGEPAGLVQLQAVADQSHAIRGTSRLVAAESLAESAARMESLAHHGRDQLNRALRHFAIVRDIAATMVDGSTDMLAMLSLELDGKPRVGKHTAAAMVLFGQILDGETAARYGLAWECVDDGSLIDRSVEIAARAASGPKELVVELKKSLHDMRAIDDPVAAMERELGPQVWSREQPWFAERLAAIKARVQSKK